ncbi:hypothetical protein GH733_013671 [Mirounga leonina]|nr:hypothetical protein GH733_013671 [Mirounga leonina]
MSYNCSTRNCSSRPIGGHCTVPVAPAATASSHDADCLSGIYLPSSFQTGSWLLDHCQGSTYLPNKLDMDIEKEWLQVKPHLQCLREELRFCECFCFPNEHANSNNATLGLHIMCYIPIIWAKLVWVLEANDKSSLFPSPPYTEPISEDKHSLLTDGDSSKSHSFITCCYWGSYGYPLGYSVGCGYGSTFSPVGYGFGYGYNGCRTFGYRRYWPFDLY